MYFISRILYILIAQNTIAIYLVLLLLIKSLRHLPILPTAGGFKIEYPEVCRRTLFRMLNFATACGRHNWHTALHANRDLAVSPFILLRVNPLQNKDSSLFALLFQYYLKRWALPTILLIV